MRSRIVRAWASVPAAVNEREVAEGLLQAGPRPRDLLCDKGFRGAAFAAAQTAHGTAVLLPPQKHQRASMPSARGSLPPGCQYPPPELAEVVAAGAAEPEAVTSCQTPPERFRPLPLACPGAVSAT